MNFVFIFLLLWTGTAWSRIEDNSFLMEEAFNQSWGMYQFIQTYQDRIRGKTYDYSFANEIPVTDKVHQFSYQFGVTKADANLHGAFGDMTLSYRWQPFNRDGILLAERFGLIVPTGSVEKGSGNGVFGFEYMQAATLAISDNWMNHWNFGFSVLPNAKTAGVAERRSLTTVRAGTSLIFLVADNFNILLEGLIESGQNENLDGTKESFTNFTINPGLRFAYDMQWKETQIVPGISFPTEILNAPYEHSVLLYLSFEPKFY